MKNTINIFKSHIARRCAALAGLVTLMLLFSSVAWGTNYYLYYNNRGNGNCPNGDFVFSDAGVNVTGNKYRWSIDLRGDNNYIYISSSQNQSGIGNITSLSQGDCGYQYEMPNCWISDAGGNRNCLRINPGTTPVTISIVVDVSNMNGCSAEISCSGGSEYIVTVDSHPHCTVDSYEKETSSGSVSFSVTVDDGWQVTNATATDAGASVSVSFVSGNTYRVDVDDVSEDCDLSIVTAPVTSGKPIVLMGKNTSTNANCDVVASAYVAYTDCSYPINKFTIYYSNNRAFRTDGNNITHHKDFNGTAGINSTYDELVIPADEVGEVVKPGSTLYLRVTASNNNSQTSVYSDIVPFQYSCDQFVTRNLLTETYTACPGKHQFTWTDMFQSPVPSECVKVELKSGSTYSEVKASDHFIRQGEQMVWVTEGKSASSYEYRLTAKSGSITGTALITISYTVPGTITEGDGLTKFEQTASITTPWTPVTFTAKGKNDSGDLTKIYWTSVPDATLSPAVESLSASSIEAESIFKAPVQNYSQNYTVTATAYTADCASSSVSTTIKVNPDNTDVCPAP